MRKISLGRKVLMGATVLSVMAMTGVVASPGAVAGTHNVARAAAHAKYTVCLSGCPFTSIQAGINAASPGAIITIGPGHYAENITVSKPVTLNGAGSKKTIVYPAVSNPDPLGCGASSLCGGSASNIILVQANNVTIENMKLEGANPSLLPQGSLVNGALVNARNGIIEDFNAGTFTNLTVTKVSVQDVFLRGIEAVGATYGETFMFSHDTVTNVDGNPNASISMFNFGGSGSMVSNTVTQASDALSANWSEGTTFRSNLVKNSASGIHTDNNGGVAGVADLITDNHVLGCAKDGYGIWVFAPYLSATVTDNIIKGCYVGLGAYGSQAAGQGPIFSINDVSGTGASTSDPNGTYGAYVTTDMLGFGCADVTARLVGNRFQRSTTGLLVTQTSPTNGDSPCSFQATVDAHGNNSFQHDTTGANGLSGTVVNATSDWWGCSKGPNTPGCSSSTGTVAFTPWLTTRPPNP
jgi:hypothetical protein